MADYVPTFTPGKAITETTSAAVTGGRLVAVSGAGTVATAAADSAGVVGVAAFDVAASGDKLTVWPIKAGGVHGLVASGAIAAGAGVVSDTGGKVKSATIATAAAAGTLLGIAKTATAADGDICQVQGG